jgi:hypothetical protein
MTKYVIDDADVQFDHQEIPYYQYAELRDTGQTHVHKGFSAKYFVAVTAIDGENDSGDILWTPELHAVVLCGHMSSRLYLVKELK